MSNTEQLGNGGLANLAEARQSMQQVRRILDAAERAYVELPELPFGVAIALRYDVGGVAVSIVTGGNEHQVYFTSGVLHNIAEDSIAPALYACNACTRDRPCYPVYLTDTGAGQDVLTQQLFPLQVLCDVPSFLIESVDNLPTVAGMIRKTIVEEYQVAGTPYAWNESDLQRLHVESLS